ncbi:hypothetical protein ACFL35_17205 [Candidatus Riflebacteria bacterium]
MSNFIFVNLPKNPHWLCEKARAIFANPLPLDLFILATCYHHKPELFGLGEKGQAFFLDLKGKEENVLNIKKKFFELEPELFILEEPLVKGVSVKSSKNINLPKIKQLREHFPIINFIPFNSGYFPILKRSFSILAEKPFKSEFMYGRKNWHHYYSGNAWDRHREFSLSLPLNLESLYCQEIDGLDLPFNFILSVIKDLKDCFPHCHLHLIDISKNPGLTLSRLIPWLEEQKQLYSLELSHIVPEYFEKCKGLKSITLRKQYRGIFPFKKYLDWIEKVSFPVHLVLKSGPDEYIFPEFESEYRAFHSIWFDTKLMEDNDNLEAQKTMKEFYRQFFFHSSWLPDKIKNLDSFSSLVQLLKQSYNLMRLVYLSR